MASFVPKGIRPPGLFPAHPRVIYKTKRKNLTHDGRIGRIDRLETLQSFGRFSRRFHAHHPRLDPELGGYLHNNGFMPDKGVLYGLPRDDMDSYLSDFQADVLPMTNGRYAVALTNRLLFWRLFGGLMPLAPLAGAVQSGRLVKGMEAADSRLLARPMLTGETAAPVWEAEVRPGGEDRCILALPPGPEEIELVRMLVLHDPDTRLPEVLAGVVLSGSLTGLDQPGAMVTSRRMDLETGIAGPALRFVRGAVAAPEPADPEPQFWPSWWAMVRDVTAGLARLPLVAMIQIDLIPLDGGAKAMIVDATDRVDPASFQVHGPLMQGDMAVRFLREFGI